MFAFESNGYIQDYSDSGWCSSTGFNSMPGRASNVTTIPFGYHFYCVGTFGICYIISGPNLYIYRSFLDNYEEESVEVTITEIPV